MKDWLARENGQFSKDAEPVTLYQQFAIDRGRLSNSAAFRRLQGKTQVLSVGEHDFFRTRLTHSIEVGNIGLQILGRLKNRASFIKKADVKEDFSSVLPPESLIQTICFAHDLGHPAFGHVGERILNYHMLEHGGFEGNGQTLRILARLGEYYPEYGFNMTRRTLLGVVKYPVLFAQAEIAAPAKMYVQGVKECGAEYRLEKYVTPRNTDDWHPPKCIHDDEKALFEWIQQPLSQADKATFLERDEEGKTKYKSLDCSIMEIADDISYALHDLEDAIAMGLVSHYQAVDELQEYFDAIWELNTSKNKEDAPTYSELIAKNTPHDLKRAITNMIATLVYHVEYEANLPFDEGLLRFNAKLPNGLIKIVKALKKFTYTNVIKHPNLQTLEYKGQRIISELFEAILANHEKLLPRSQVEQIQGGKVSLHRSVCDYLASMTDREAGAMYERLFLPSAGTVFQPV